MGRSEPFALKGADRPMRAVREARHTGNELRSAAYVEADAAITAAQQWIDRIES